MTIDVRSEEGNIFVILGAFRRLMKELEKAKCDVKEYRDLLARAPLMKYDAIFDEVERITNGTITFNGREPER